MKLKLDENLPVELTQRLSGHDTDTVAAEALTWREDRRVFAAAVCEDRPLITQDLDFSDVRHFRPGTHPGIILIRLRDPSRRRLLERITQVFATQDIERWAGCFVVVSDRKLRVRRP